jgi:Tol biopolymer transport system component
LVFSRDIDDANLWEYELATPSGPVRGSRRIAASTELDEEGRYSPDGRSIAFLSRRSGPTQLWRYDNATGQVHRLTDLADIEDGTVFWHPKDARAGISVSQAGRGPSAYFAGSGTSSLQHAFSGVMTEMACSVSRDGRWLYFRSTRTGRFELWKVAMDNTGRELQVTNTGGAYGVESFDGKKLYYCPRHEDEGVWEMPVEGGTPTRLTGALARRSMMAVGRDGIYYLARNTPPRLMMYRFADRKHIELATIDKYPGWGMDITPDGKRLVIGLYDVLDSDVMIVRDFR